MSDRSAMSRLGSTFAAAAAVAAIAFSASTLAASAPTVNEKFSDLEPAIKMMRDEAGQDRRDIVKANMLLTETEATKFWPLYDAYRDARNKVADRKVKLITDFAANKDSMAEDEAARLTKEFFSIEKKKIQVKEAYVAKMTKVLSSRTVARFFQIDQKLDAIVDAGIAANVPLMH
jgi:Spy/CpxP family protein refolding chaperone